MTPSSRTLWACSSSRSVNIARVLGSEDGAEVEGPAEVAEGRGIEGLGAVGGSGGMGAEVDGSPEVSAR